MYVLERHLLLQLADISGVVTEGGTWLTCIGAIHWPGLLLSLFLSAFGRVLTSVFAFQPGFNQAAYQCGCAYTKRIINCCRFCRTCLQEDRAYCIRPANRLYNQQSTTTLDALAPLQVVEEVAEEVAAAKLQ